MSMLMANVCNVMIVILYLGEIVNKSMLNAGLIMPKLDGVLGVSKDMTLITMETA